jgi:hypothetical protein
MKFGENKVHYCTFRQIKILHVLHIFISPMLRQGQLCLVAGRNFFSDIYMKLYSHSFEQTMFLEVA